MRGWSDYHVKMIKPRGLPIFAAVLTLIAAYPAWAQVDPAPEQSSWLTVVVSIALVVGIVLISVARTKREFRD